MEAMLGILVGLGLRIVLPLAITGLLVYFLRRLDARWQKEASNQMQPIVEKPECWKIKDCPEEKRKVCLGAQSPEPCWQAFRAEDGCLKGECLTCKIFRQAPIPLKA